MPWGLNVLFAAAVTPQLRGWDLLTPMLLLLVLVAALVTWRRLGWRWPPLVVWSVAGLTCVVLVLDAVLPYRAVFAEASASASALADEGRAYGARLDAGVPGSCGVLQLPYIPFPEVPPLAGMGNYEHLWVALTDTEKSWSFGAVKGTRADAFAAGLGDHLDPRTVRALRDAGFCAVHVDLRGYADPDATREVADLTALLGPPVAEVLGGRWLAFALPRR